MKFGNLVSGGMFAGQSLRFQSVNGVLFPQDQADVRVLEDKLAKIPGIAQKAQYKPSWKHCRRCQAMQCTAPGAQISSCRQGPGRT